MPRGKPGTRFPMAKLFTLMALPTFWCALRPQREPSSSGGRKPASECGPGRHLHRSSSQCHYQEQGCFRGERVPYDGRQKRWRRARGPDKVVLASGELNALSRPLDGVADILHDPSLLPPTLLIHHCRDSCRVTNPAAVAPLPSLGWRSSSQGCLDRRRHTEGTGGCASLGHHGFGGKDAEVVSQVVDFAGTDR